MGVIKLKYVLLSVVFVSLFLLGCTQPNVDNAPDNSSTQSVQKPTSPSSPSPPPQSNATILNATENATAETPPTQNLTPPLQPPPPQFPPPKTKLNVSAEPIPIEIVPPASDPFNDPNGPYYHQVYSALSKDGLSWQTEEKLVFNYASVPGAVIRKDNTILVYYVDGTMTTTSNLIVAKSTDLGKTWVKYAVAFDSPPQGKSCSADPEPEELENGTLRLYLLCFLFGSGGPSSTEVISALSENGIVFSVEKGVRATSKPGETLTDPDVVKIGDIWKMYISYGTSVVSFSSSDGLNFVREAGYRNSAGAVTNSVVFEGKLRHYFCGKDGIGSALSTGGDWSVEGGTRVPKGNFKIICDPNVVKLPDGTYKMFYKVQK